MNDTTITKALQSASQILKGTIPADITIDDLSAAMADIAKVAQRPTETVEQAFTRLLVDECDPRLVKLHAAQDALRAGGSRSRAGFAKLIKQVEDDLDDYARANAKPGEDVPAATARLHAAEDSSFLKLLDILERARIAHDS